MAKRIVLGGLALVVCLLLYLGLWPVPIDPVAYQPPTPPPLDGAYSPNNYLADVELLLEGAGDGPEDVDVDAEGRIYGGMVDGRIMRSGPDGKNAELFADTGGRPFGLEFDTDGNLIVADGVKGLLSIAPDGTITTLTTESDGVPFMFTDDLDIAPDGKIYFSDASSKYGIHEVNEDILEHGGHGRLVMYDPVTGTTETLADGLQFANGVAVSPDGSFVLINETGSYCVNRFWLEGPKAGTMEPFIQNLPGFPDGISSNGEGLYWLAIYAPRAESVDILHPSPALKKLVFRLPAFLRPVPVMYGFVLGLDGDGNVVHNLQDPTGAFAPVTSVEEVNGTLYLGSLTYPAAARIAKPETPQ